MLAQKDEDDIASFSNVNICKASGRTKHGRSVGNLAQQSIFLEKKLRVSCCGMVEVSCLLLSTWPPVVNDINHLIWEEELKLGPRSVCLALRHGRQALLKLGV